jgi:capsular polysaccharide biosynthesis protein
MLQKIKNIIVIITIIGTIGGGLLSKHLINENNRLERNQEILVSKNKEKTQSLVMDKRELKELR